MPKAKAKPSRSRTPARKAAPARTAKAPKGTAQLAHATTRTSDAWIGRRQQATALELCSMYAGWVKVAASRNAAAVASTPLRVYRAVSSGKRSMFTGKRLGWADVIQRSAHWGPEVRKFIDHAQDGIEEVTDPTHPYVSILNRPVTSNPNAACSGFELRESTELWLGLCGNAYWKRIDGPEWPVELWPLAAPFVRPVPDRERIIGAYIYGRGSENEQSHDADTVVHHRRPNPTGDPYGGFADLSACFEAAVLSVLFEQHAIKSMEQGAHPSAWVNAPGVGADELKMMQDHFEQRHAGVAKGGRTFFTNIEGATVANLGDISRELSYLSSEKSVRDKIANCFDMPIALLTMDTAALAQAKEAMPQWQTLSIAPRCRRMDDRMNASLSPAFRRALNDDSLFVASDNPVGRDAQADATRVNVLVSGGIITPNEARAELSYERIEGGDELRNPAASNPFGFGPEREQPKPGDKGDPKVDPDEGEDDTKGLKLVKRAKAPAVPTVEIVTPKRLTDALWAKGQAGACCDHGPRTPRAGLVVVKEDKAPSQTVTMTVNELEAALQRWFGHAYSVVDPRIDYAAGTLGLRVEDSPELVAKLRTDTRPPLVRMITSGYADGYTGLPEKGDAPASFLETDRLAIRAIDRYQGRMIRSVTRTTSARIEATLAEGIAKGVSPTDTRNAVRDLLGPEGSGYAAEAIARTETSRAFHAGREEAWDQSGLVEGKEWLLSGNPCPICTAMAEQFKNVPIGATLVEMGEVVPGSDTVNDYGPILYPPAHPNCACSLGAVFVPAVGG